MTQTSVHVQIAPTSVPSTPSWLGEVAVVAHVFRHLGLQTAIEERVRFARARMGRYEVIDFVVMLIGYALSGERTLQAFWERLLPFADPFMALFGRSHLPHPATLSRFLAALDPASVEALRTLFEEDLVARSPFGSLPGGVWDRQGTHWTIIDIDGTRASRQATSASPDAKPSSPPPSYEPGVCSWIPGAQAGRSGVWRGLLPGTAILPDASKTLAEAENASF